MNKTIAISIFGRAKDLASALGVNPAAISQWPQTLDAGRSDRVAGAALRLGLSDRLPPPYQPPVEDRAA
jgi:hypothetical protein